MKLNQDQIHFIDTYLQNSEVIYKDVRLEMADHVASGIEQEWAKHQNESFREVFKSYMVTNKKQLLDDFKAFRKKTTKRLFLELGKAMIKPVSLLLGLLVFMVFFYSQELIYNAFGNLYTHWKAISLVVVILLVLVWYVSKRFIVKDSYIAIEQLMWVLIFLHYGASFVLDIIIGFIPEGYKNIVTLVLSVIYVMLFINFIKVLRSHIIYYKNKYQNVS